MQIINSKEEYLEFWPYINKKSCTNFPKRYPCFCEKEHEDGGLMGCYWEIEIYYLPEDIKTKREIDFFLRGLNRDVEIESYSE